jgi:hypothetical protein
MHAEDLIDALLEGEDVEDIIEDQLGEEPVRTSRRPRKRRFGKRGVGVNPLTGKRKDPRARMRARRTARRFKAKRARAAKRFARSARGKQFHKKLGRLSARIRR